MTALHRAFKRLVDVVFSFAVVVVLQPLLLPTMLLLRLTGEGEVFFVQRRIGKGQKGFGLLKFVTMRRDSPSLGTVTAKNDPRILPVGRILRTTKINELPQFLNVLKGDMSMVGPRPLTPEAFSHYAPDVQSAIARMRPGVTGIGSLVFRDEERILYESKKDKMACYREDIMPLKGALERWYSEHCSLWLDLKIVLATPLAVAFPRSRFYINWFPVMPLIAQSRLRSYFGVEGDAHD